MSIIFIQQAITSKDIEGRYHQHPNSFLHKRDWLIYEKLYTIKYWDVCKRDIFESYL